MAICPTAALAVLSISFNGIIFNPIPKKTKFKLGGIIYADGIMDTAGRYTPIADMMAGELSTSLPLNADFTRAQLDGCGDLQVLTNTGKTYLITNASLAEDPEFSDDGGVIEVKFKGDAGNEF